MGFFAIADSNKDSMTAGVRRQRLVRTAVKVGGQKAMAMAIQAAEEVSQQRYKVHQLEEEVRAAEAKQAQAQAKLAQAESSAASMQAQAEATQHAHAQKAMMMEAIDVGAKGAPLPLGQTPVGAAPVPKSGTTLPAGWEARSHPSGNVQYCNTETGEKSWIKPT